MNVMTAIAAVLVAGCASWSASMTVARGDRLATRGDFEGALRAYDDAVTHGADGRAGARARAGQASVGAALAAREETVRLRAELVKREDELTRLRAEVERLGRDLSARDGELTRTRQDLTSRQAELIRVGLEAEQLRLDLEKLKSIEMRLERRRP